MSEKKAEGYEDMALAQIREAQAELQDAYTRLIDAAEWADAAKRVSRSKKAKKLYRELEMTARTNAVAVSNMKRMLTLRSVKEYLEAPECWLGGNTTEIYESGLCHECWVWVEESGVVNTDASEDEIKAAYWKEQARMEREANERGI